MSKKIKVSEALLTKKVSMFLDNLPNCWYYKTYGGGFQIRGLPDIVGIINGQGFALELKADGGAPSQLQIRQLRLIAEADGSAWVVFPDDWEEVKQQLIKLGGK